MSSQKPKDKEATLHEKTQWLAPAKLNLFLHVTAKRDDGYHALETVFQFIDLYDYVTISVNDTGAIYSEQPMIGVEDNDNLAIKAAKLLQAKAGCSYGAVIAIDKNIPMGAGMGGGSSNAATVLIALNKLWQLHYSREELMAIGRELGADVPIFIYGQNAFAKGIGDELSAIDLPIDNYLIAVPDVHCSTAKIFSDPNLCRNTKEIDKIDFAKHQSTYLGFTKQAYEEDAKQAIRETHNDFMPVVIKAYPEIKAAIETLSLVATKLQHEKSLINDGSEQKIIAKTEQFKINAKMTGTGAGVFVRIEDAEKSAIHSEILELQKKSQKTAFFFIKSLSIHPHW